MVEGGRGQVALRRSEPAVRGQVKGGRGQGAQKKGIKGLSPDAGRGRGVENYGFGISKFGIRLSFARSPLTRGNSKGLNVRM